MNKIETCNFQSWKRNWIRTKTVVKTETAIGKNQNGYIKWKPKTLFPKTENSKPKK